MVRELSKYVVAALPAALFFGLASFFDAEGAAGRRLSYLFSWLAVLALVLIPGSLLVYDAKRLLVARSLRRALAESKSSETPPPLG